MMAGAADSLPTTVADVLRARRQAAGLTQRELAVSAGISEGAVRDLEQGRTRTPHPRSLRALGAALALPAAEVEQLVRTNSQHRAVTPPDPTDPVTVLDEPVTIAVLGSLSVHVDGDTVPLAADQPRTLLGRLALSPNTAVPRDELIDVLWDRLPPPSAVNLVQTYVARLRRLLGAARQTPTGLPTVALASAGYRLNLQPAQSDVLLFRALVQDARAAAPASPERATELLDQALRLWRGDPVVDVDRLVGHPLAVTLTEERINAALTHADLADATGRLPECVPGLRALASQHPLHEPLHARLMLALAASGLQAAGLGVFDEIAHRLADELGMSPGRELGAYRQRVLRQQWNIRPDSPGTARAVLGGRGAVPAQLPAAIPGFTGRATHLQALDAVTAVADDPPSAVVVAVCGTAGVGKTALAVHWAHRVRHRFPDGQLYVNLRGFDPAATVMTPGEAIRRFLDALGVPLQRVPATVDAQAALYRTLLAGKKMLVLLDNACDPDQVRPLLPGDPRCLVLVTSRSQLTGLVVAEGANLLPVDLLSVGEARDLLARRIGAARTTAEPDAVEEMITRCARLPLALALAAARATIHPRLPLAALTDELRDTHDRLDALSIDDQTTDMRAVLSWSYQALAPAQARLFRLLGLQPGPDISTFAAASLAGIPAPDVRPLLAALTAANLIDEHTPGRYTFHDLLRAYATERAYSDEPGAERQAAIERVLDHYLYTAHAANRMLHPNRDPITLTRPCPAVTPETFNDDEEARGWFTVEHPVLLAAVQQAAQQRYDRRTWQLAWTLATFLDRWGHWHDWTATQEAALDAARRMGDRPGEAYSHRLLGLAHTRLSRQDDAIAHLLPALEIFREVGDQTAWARVHVDLAHTFARRSHYRQALDQARYALDLFTATGHQVGQATALNAMGWYHAQLADYPQALACCRQALALFQESGERHGEANTWDSLGFVHNRLGQHEQAITCYQQALALFRQIGDRYYEAAALNGLGDAHWTVNNLDAARYAWQHALDILDSVNHPNADTLRTKLQQTNPSNADAHRHADPRRIVDELRTGGS
jgi:DNA-binding SARP family transcriptional activator/tetratricopeptide (TPR) repeat protein/transcriptional regulator with XRE-family HTH domain